MFKAPHPPHLIAKRFFGRPSLQTNPIPRRPLKKIRLGKARPAIYHKFDCLVELSDGSVIQRKSQYPKTEIRMITDQRNNPLWNESRPDLSIVDVNARGRLNKFKEKYSQYEQEEEPEENKDELFNLLGENHQEVKLGGNLAQRTKNKR